MRTIIPSNTYPLKPTASAAFWQLIERDGTKRVASTGKVPLWVCCHDGGGPTRIVTVLIVRVLPTAEVVLVGNFQDEAVWQKTETVMTARRSKSSWPERVWWVSHVVYLAQPSKRKTSLHQRKRIRPWYARFCNGRLVVRPKQSSMLAYVPVQRLKVMITPNQSKTVIEPDIEFSADESNRYKPAVTRFFSSLLELPQPEQNLIHKALGHRLGDSYVSALSDASSRFAVAAGLRRASDSASSLREFMSEDAEQFETPDWLDAPQNDGIRCLMLSTLAFTRFPMGDGPDPEFAVRPWLPEALVGILDVKQPIDPSMDIACELVPMKKERAVLAREVIGALSAYAPDR